MRIGAVDSSALVGGGRRMTASYFLPRDLEAATALDQASEPRQPLHELCRPGGIFRGPIFKRIPAAGPDYGRPYVKPSQLERLHVGIEKYLSKLHGDLLDVLALREGMILVTCSGKSLGKVIFAREDLDGLVASHDLIRVCPDPDLIHPGYLYAYLSSRIGKVAIRRQIYGTSVVHVEPEHLFDLPVLRLPPSVESRIGEETLEGQREISRGLGRLTRAHSKLQESLGIASAPSEPSESD